MLKSQIKGLPSSQSLITALNSDFYRIKQSIILCLSSFPFNYGTFAGLMEIKEFNYSANFCEENIWHLCQNQELVGFSKKVLIISNAKRNCPFKFQKSINGDEVVWWNYHVVLLADNKDSAFIYDFDSTLPVPSTAKEYFSKTFDFSINEGVIDSPYFKIIDSDTYLDSFNSDRGHMKDSFGKWLSEPPKWQIIGGGGELPLPELLDFTESSKHQIYNLDEIWSHELS